MHFIDLQETMDVSEEQQQEEQDIDEQEELRRRLCEAETCYRQKKELHDRLFKHGLDTEALINEMTAENQNLTSKVTENQQRLEDIRKRREENDEEALRQELLFEEKCRKLRSQEIHIRKMETKNKKLREKNKDLTAELEKISLIQKNQEEIQTLRTAEQELKHKLEQVQEVLRSKDEEKEKTSMTLVKIHNEIEEYGNIIEDLRQDQRELREQLSRSQEEQILAAQKKSRTKSTKTQSLDSSAMDVEYVEHKDVEPLKNEKWWCHLKGLWKGVKVAGHIALCVLLPMGIMASMVPVCNSPDPDCNLWNIAFNLLEPYGELHHTHVY